MQLASRPQRTFSTLAGALAFCGFLATCVSGLGQDGLPERHWLFVAVPGVRDYLEYGGHGLLVFDIDRGHKFVKRIATAGVDEHGKPLNVKGICCSAITGRMYISTTRQLMCLDLASEAILWEKEYEAGCDRMAIVPDGKMIYLPSLEGPHWVVVDAVTGDVMRKLVTNSGAHNTVCGLSGDFAYLAGLKSPLLRVADTKTDHLLTVGPFSGGVRPFTIDGRETRCYVNVNDLLGFEIGDLKTGQKLASVTVQGFEKGPTKRHGCPSHGIGLTPDETELWLTDAANRRVHVFDATVMPPRQLASIELRDQPGWITFSVDGKYAYPSTGDVIDTKTRQIVALLADEEQRQVQSEKMIEIDLRGTRAVRAGDQFGIGRVVADAK
jgi:DNA-binding beta-propeller fold protein YncE